MPASDEQMIKNLIQNEIIIDYYLDQKQERDILLEAGKRGLPVHEARYLLEEELERVGAVSERLLLEELERHLHIYTDRDKVLDKKEYNDAVQFITRPKPGRRKGLKVDVAQKYIQDFCAANGVKIKKGKFLGLF